MYNSFARICLVCGVLIAPILAGNAFALDSPPALSQPSKTAESTLSADLLKWKGKNYSEMSVAESIAYLKLLSDKTPHEIFEIWIMAGQNGDKEWHSVLGTTFSITLEKQPPDRDFQLELDQFLTNPNMPGGEKLELVSILGNAATKESTEQLLKWSRMDLGVELSNAVITALSKIGREVGQYESRAERSLPLEREWVESHDPKMLSAVSQSMAAIGSPTAIELLLKESLIASREDSDRKTIALIALKQVSSDSATEIFAKVLKQQSSMNPTAELVSKALANIGSPAASEALVVWLQQSDDSVAPLAGQLVSNTRTTALLKAWDTALNGRTTFRSESVEKAIRDNLDDYRKGRK